MKRILIFSLFIAVLLFLSKGILYRSLVKYKDVGQRPEVVIIDESLIRKIEDKTPKSELNLSEILQLAQNITTEELTFSTKKVSNNPNKLIYTHQANCIGYSAMFNAVINYLLRKNKLHHKIKAYHKIGQLEVLGNNIHRFIKNPFFIDHDYNEVINTQTNERILIDPSLSDYFYINRVSPKQVK